MEGLYSSNKTIPNLDIESRGLNHTTILVVIVVVVVIRKETVYYEIVL